jgi:hypothetical protein
MSRITLVLGLIAAVALALASSDASAASIHPMLKVLSQFDDAPATGPNEAPMPTPRPIVTTGTAAVSGSAAVTSGTGGAVAEATPSSTPLDILPGNGLAQHPFLYYGEGANVVYVVNRGKVVWSYAFPKGGEIDDAWMLTNGDIICTAMLHCYEVTPRKKIVWTYDCPPGTQIHALQPVGLDQVMVVENGTTPHFYILNKSDNSKALSHQLIVSGTTTVHVQFRNCRITADGTYLLPYLQENHVDEYTKHWKKIWTYTPGRAWDAVRLKNGDTLIAGDQRGFVHEVNPDGKIVWAVEKNDIPGITLYDVQTAGRLANGDTVICNHDRPRAANGFKPVQVVEVTPDKKIVWALRDWKDLPFPCSGIQLLDEPGNPEHPGELQR